MKALDRVAPFFLTRLGFRYISVDVSKDAVADTLVITDYAQILQNLLPFRTVELLLGPVDPAAAEAKSVCSEHEVSHYQAPVVEIGG